MWLEAKKYAILPGEFHVTSVYNIGVGKDGNMLETVIVRIFALILYNENANMRHVIHLVHLDVGLPKSCQWLRYITLKNLGIIKQSYELLWRDCDLSNCVVI